jgi:hypothetical protein
MARSLFWRLLFLPLVAVSLSGQSVLDAGTGNDASLSACADSFDVVSLIHLGMTADEVDTLLKERPCTPAIFAPGSGPGPFDLEYQAGVVISYSGPHDGCRVVGIKRINPARVGK